MSMLDETSSLKLNTIRCWARRNSKEDKVTVGGVWSGRMTRLSADAV
jgi:hypothetical protein